MARRCAVCEKGLRIVNLVSNANNRVKRKVYPNVHTMRYIEVGSAKKKVQRANVCTRCVKAGKIQKVI